MTSAKKKDALKVLKILEDAGYEARLVGGCVRDTLLGLEPKDYDIATSARPEELLALFKATDVKTLLYGQEHGTITPLMPSGPVEVTSLREDVETHGRHAQVAFHTDFRTDACRRDFTINAMSQNRSGKVYDYFEGQKHLQEKRLVFVGDATTRIQEDYLRILRFFRFQARFGLKSNAATAKAIASNLIGLSIISHERVTHEIFEILRCETIMSTLHLMTKTGVFQFIFPPFDMLSTLARTTCLMRLDRLSKVPEEYRPQARIALVLMVMNISAKKEPAKLLELCAQTLIYFKIRLSKKDQRLILALVEACSHLMLVKSRCADALLFVDACEQKTEGLFLKAVVPFLKVYYANSPLRLHRLKKIIEFEAQFGGRRVSMPLDGKQLMQRLEISSGALVGEALKALRYSYLEGEWETAEDGIAWLMNKR